MLITQFATTFLIATAFILAVFGWGALICRRHFDGELLEYFTARIVIGLGVIYLGCLALSIPRLMTRMPVAGLLIVGMGMCALDIERIANKFREAFKEILHWKRSEVILLAVVFLLAFLQLVCGLTPLIFYDVLVYHISAPAEFLRQGSLTHIPWNVSTDTPMALQLTLGTSLVLDESGATFKMLLAFLGLLMPLSVATLVKPSGSRIALWAAAIVLAYPEFWVQQTLGAVDLGAGALAVIGAAWLWRAFQKSSIDWLIGSAVAFGLALSSRYQNAPVVGIAAAFVIIAAFKTDAAGARKVVFRFAAVSLLIVSVMLAPWLIRNAVNTGNPVYPLLFGTLGGKDWSTAQVQTARSDALGATLAELPLLSQIIAPVGTLMLSPSNGLFGIILLLGALATLIQPADHIGRAYAAIGIVGVAVWGFIKPALGASVIRYNAASILFVMAVTAAFLVGPRLQELGPRLCWVLTAGSLIIAFAHLQNIVPVTSTVVSDSERQAFYRAQNSSWQAFDFMNRELDGTHDRVLFVGETRAFWARLPVIAPGPFNGPQLEEFLPPDNFAVWQQRLAQRGITHIFISGPEWQRLNQRYGYFRLTEKQSKELADWLHKYPIVFDDRHGNTIFALAAN